MDISAILVIILYLFILTLAWIVNKQRMRIETLEFSEKEFKEVRAGLISSGILCQRSLIEYEVGHKINWLEGICKESSSELYVVGKKFEALRQFREEDIKQNDNSHIQFRERLTEAAQINVANAKQMRENFVINADKIDAILEHFDLLLVPGSGVKAIKANVTRDQTARIIRKRKRP